MEAWFQEGCPVVRSAGHMETEPLPPRREGGPEWLEVTYLRDNHHEWRMLDKATVWKHPSDKHMAQQVSAYDFYCIFCLRQTRAVRDA